CPNRRSTPFQFRSRESEDCVSVRIRNSFRRRARAEPESNTKPEANARKVRCQKKKLRGPAETPVPTLAIVAPSLAPGGGYCRGGKHQFDPASIPLLRQRR